MIVIPINYIYIVILYYTENCLELVVTIPTPRDGWIRIETFRMSPRMRQPAISRGSQSDYTTHHDSLLLLEHLAIFSGKHSPGLQISGKNCQA